MFNALYQSFSRLSQKGVLGMNKRNIDYISRYNPRHLFPLVDNKLLTKNLALEHNLKVPHLLGVIESQHDIQFLETILKKHLKIHRKAWDEKNTNGKASAGFCLKPAKGSGGKGILVIVDAKLKSINDDDTKQQFVFYKSNGQEITLADLKRHATNILAGLFSLGGAIDNVLIEDLIVLDPLLAPYTYEGIPDIRVIVFKGIPVMAMMRLSTSASDGKANLHQGAVGVGINIATGKAVNAVQNNLPIQKHPDTKQNLFDLAVPSWDTLLTLACECADLTGLGYIGVDLVLDAVQGPTVLELNARPGLSIQIANDEGLVTRLKKIENIKRVEKMPLLNRLEFAKSEFSQ